MPVEDIRRYVFFMCINYIIQKEEVPTFLCIVFKIYFIHFGVAINEQNSLRYEIIILLLYVLTLSKHCVTNYQYNIYYARWTSKSSTNS